MFIQVHFTPSDHDVCYSCMWTVALTSDFTPIQFKNVIEMLGWFYYEQANKTWSTLNLSNTV